MIAYNYCYSTCLGRVQPFQEKYKFGVVNLDLPNGLVGQMKDNITGKYITTMITVQRSLHGGLVAPNGIMYVKSNIRRGLLGRMLTELLDTRVMVKQAMKGAKNDRVSTMSR